MGIHRTLAVVDAGHAQLLARLSDEQRTLLRTMEELLPIKMGFFRGHLFGADGKHTRPMLQQGICLMASRHPKMLLQSNWLGTYFELSPWLVGNYIVAAEHILRHSPTSAYAAAVRGVWHEVNVEPAELCPQA